MPSQKVLDEKKQVVADLVVKIKNATSGVLVNYEGISVEKDTALRAEFRKNDIDYTVIKNTLAKFALKELGITGLDELLNGTTAMAVSNDATAPARVIAKFSKTNEKYEIKGGFMDGKAIDAATVKAIAEIPSKEVLIGRFLGSLKAPITNFVYLLNAVAEKNA